MEIRSPSQFDGGRAGDLVRGEETGVLLKQQLCLSLRFRNFVKAVISF